MFLPPLNKPWQVWQVTATVGILFKTWILFSYGFQLWNLASHSGKNFPQLPVIQDEKTSSSIESEVKRGVELLSSAVALGREVSLKLNSTKYYVL